MPVIERGHRSYLTDASSESIQNSPGYADAVQERGTTHIRAHYIRTHGSNLLRNVGIVNPALDLMDSLGRHSCQH